MQKFIPVIVYIIFAAGFAWQMIVYFKNAYEIRKVMYSDSSKEVKAAFRKQITTGLLYLVFLICIIIQAISELKKMSSPQ